MQKAFLTQIYGGPQLSHTLTIKTKKLKLKKE